MRKHLELELELPYEPQSRVVVLTQPDGVWVFDVQEGTWTKLSEVPVEVDPKALKT